MWSSMGHNWILYTAESDATLENNSQRLAREIGADYGYSVLPGHVLTMLSCGSCKGDRVYLEGGLAGSTEIRAWYEMHFQCGGDE